MRPESLTAIAHEQITPFLLDGSIAIDATAGNGHDTLFLATQVGDAGRVFAFDIQPEAINATHARLQQAGLLSRCSLINASHASFDDAIPQELKGKITAIIYNLGYLPRGDKAVVTHTGSTIASLDQALEWLASGGVISVLAYTGHPGGEAEADAIEQWLREQCSKLTSIRINPESPAASPRLFKVVKA